MTKQRYSVKVGAKWFGSFGHPMTGTDGLVSTPAFRAVIESRAEADRIAAGCGGVVMLDTLTATPTEAA